MDAYGQRAHKFVHRTPGVYIRRRRTQITRVNEMRVSWRHLYGRHPYRVERVPVRVDWIATTSTITREEDVLVPNGAQMDLCDQQDLIAHPVIYSDNGCQCSTYSAPRPNFTTPDFPQPERPNVHKPTPTFTPKSENVQSYAGDQARFKLEPSSPRLHLEEGLPGEEAFQRIKQEHSSPKLSLGERGREVTDPVVGVKKEYDSNWPYHT